MSAEAGESPVVEQDGPAEGPAERSVTSTTTVSEDPRQKARRRKPVENRVLGCGPVWPDEWQARRAALFDFLEDPESSRLAGILSLFVLVVILISITAFVLETTKLGMSVPENTRNIIEWFCTLVFTLELGSRFMVCNVYGSSGWIFLRSPLNVFDFMAVVPTYIDLITMWMGSAGQDGLSILRIGRLVRVLRLVKVARYTSGLNTVVEGLRRSVQALFLLLAAVCLCMVLSSSMIYYAEAGVEPIEQPDGTLVDRYVSIPMSFWWAIVTMTTVGYGDYSPVSPLGKVIAGFTMLFGILLIALPMAIVGNKFQEVYEENEIKAGRRRGKKDLRGEACKRHEALVQAAQKRLAQGLEPDPCTPAKLQLELRDLQLLHQELQNALQVSLANIHEVNTFSGRLLSECPKKPSPQQSSAVVDGTGGTPPSETKEPT